MLNKDKRKASRDAYYQRNKEKVIARCKAYREANPEKVSNSRKSYALNNPDKVLTSLKEFREKNPEKVVLSRAKQLIIKTTGLKNDELPNDLVEAKFMQLLVINELKK